MAKSVGMGERSFARSINGGEVMTALVARFARDESGATAIEYGLIASGIALAIIAAVNGVGGALNTKLTAVKTALTTP